ncbi:unnamed protein product, partial [Effrenium voratum]
MSALPMSPGTLRQRGSPMNSSPMSSPMEKGQGCSRIPTQKAIKGGVTFTRRVIKISSLSLFLIIFLIAFLGWPSKLIEENVHRHILAFLFLTGIKLVALEDVIRLDKAAIMLIMASVMWTYRAASIDPSSEQGQEQYHKELGKALEDVGSVLLFLLPAMGLVESIDHLDGFAAVTARLIQATKDSAGRLMPMIFFLAFFLSSVIDNLTATIVCVKILQRVVPHNRLWRHSCGGLVVVAANAGGAWSPVGDVTTTMLWIQHKISTLGTVTWLFLPSFVAGVVPLLGIWWYARRYAHEGAEKEKEEVEVPVPTRNGSIILAAGMFCILTVPVVKTVTGLPPYLGMMMALGVFWLTTELGELGSEGNSVPHALHKVDLSSLLFFTGVLMAISCLDAAGVLKQYAETMHKVTKGSPMALAALLGVSSAVVDNVPLVQA